MFYLGLNDDLFEIRIAGTEFSYFWRDWVFSENTEVETNFNQEGIQDRIDQYRFAVNNLRSIIDRNNEFVQRQGFDDKYLYQPIGEHPSPQLLVDTHEKWADFTKQKFEPKQPNPDHDEIYNIINHEMHKNGWDYKNINDFVHQVEFKHKFFLLHQINLVSPPIAYSYIIKPEDTSFTRELIALPYQDVGRPQFEKFQVSGLVDHEEISNYRYLVNRIEITCAQMQENVPKQYYEKCRDQGVHAYGNHVPLFKTSSYNPGASGYFMLKNLRSDGQNRLFLKTD